VAKTQRKAGAKAGGGENWAARLFSALKFLRNVGKGLSPEGDARHEESPDGAKGAQKMAQKCNRANCDGTIVDGVCDECGRAPLGKTLLPASAAAAAPAPAPVHAPVPGGTVSARVNTVSLGGTTRTTSMTGTVGSNILSTAMTGSTTRGSSRRTSSRSAMAASSRRRSLGAGLVSLPDEPTHDPLAQVMANPVVPLAKRRCPSCQAHVKREKGFCPACGAEYNFEPSLKTGDIVAGKFEVKGPVAFGGMGWIYLAWDQMLSRWVILKGLLNAKDEAAAAAALQERQFLAALKNPKIVGIYDFVNQGAEGYIVMERVGGRTIEAIRKARDIVRVKDESDKVLKDNVLRETLTDAEKDLKVEVIKRGLLTVEEACAYIIAILPAFAYLHSRGVVYCDFKAENFMLEGDDVKLIDMGGARRIDDPNGDIFGTQGFMAQEAADNPIEVSDLFSVGRTLAALTMDFDFRKKFEFTLPPAAEQPLLQKNEAFARFLDRSTRQNPDERFASAEEMEEQLRGVLREIVALASDPKPAESRLFSADNFIDPEDRKGRAAPLARLLPTLKADPTDDAADECARLAAQGARSVIAFEELTKAKPQSIEAKLRLMDARLMTKKADQADMALKEASALMQADPFEWRALWMAGKAALSLGEIESAEAADDRAAQAKRVGRAAEAAILFEKAYSWIPGEWAPKLGLAFAKEASGDRDGAMALYNRVARLDPGVGSAIFGLARCEEQAGAMEAAAQALALAPASHSLHSAALEETARALLSDAKAASMSAVERACQALEALGTASQTARQLAARALAQAAALIESGLAKADPAQTMLGAAKTKKALRQQAEKMLRDAARQAGTREEMVFLVDLANQARPRTWL
jgi:serine/threonine-protein kinase PknG